MNKGTAIKLPKHKAVMEMLKSIFSKEEASLLSVFEKTGQPLPAENISQLSGVPKERVVQVFDDMAYKGKVVKAGNFYVMMPFVPGLFEVYFTHNRDDPKKMKKAASVQRIILLRSPLRANRRQLHPLPCYTRCGAHRENNRNKQIIRGTAPSFTLRGSKGVSLKG
nr:hypothetical protein [Candidatus Freyarchaeota archaeon]